MTASKPLHCMSLLIVTLLISACQQDSGGSTLPETRGADGTYLYVTHRAQALDSDNGLYYGTRNVSTRTALAVRVANRGADVYPLKSIAIMPPDDEGPRSDNSEEFAVDVLDNIVLQPAQAVTLDVAFQPITDGEKYASLVIDYDTIKQVDASVNQNEQVFYAASDLEAAGDILTARNGYNDYLANDPVTINKRRASIRLPIIDEALKYDGGDDVVLYLDAMRDREYEDFDQSMRKLDIFAAMYPDSYLADDALYLRAYTQLMDLDQPIAALRSIKRLRQQFPDTTYYDTSVYIEAMAQLDIGNQLVAREILQALKERHTGIDALGIQLPKDNLLSRMWFDRATQALAAS